MARWSCHNKQRPSSIRLWRLREVNSSVLRPTGGPTALGNGVPSPSPPPSLAVVSPVFLHCTMSHSLLSTPPEMLPPHLTPWCTHLHTSAPPPHTSARTPPHFAHLLTPHTSTSTPPLLPHISTPPPHTSATKGPARICAHGRRPLPGVRDEWIHVAGGYSCSSVL